MEERKLTEKESLELISKMIRNTQTKMEENSGAMFLIWGYLTVFSTLLVWSLMMISFNYNWQCICILDLIRSYYVVAILESSNSLPCITKSLGSGAL